LKVPKQKLIVGGNISDESSLHFIVLQAEMYANVGIKKLVKNSLQRSEM